MRRLLGQRCYVDANVLVYFLERDERWHSTVDPLFESAAQMRLRLVTGDAAVAEVMVLPYRSGSEELVGRFAQFFGSAEIIDVLPHTSADFDRAARIQAERPMRMMDALHLATAAIGGCSYIVTNDLRMRSVPGMEVVQLQDLEELDG
jgi:predicted nucleic acid-binding protein